MSHATPTSATSTPPPTATQLTLFQADSPASPTARPVKEKEKTIRDTSGRKCLESFALSSRVGSWAKTYAALLLGRTDWYSKKCALIWNLRATRYNRLYFLLQVSTRRTSASEYGLLPTVRANESTEDFATGKRPSGAKKSKNLTWAANTLIPTPTLNGNNNRKGLTPKSGDGLATWAKQMLPTPRTSDGNGTGIHGDGGMDLRTAVKLLPTPTTNDAANSTLPSSQKDRDGLAGTMLTSWMNGQLNPPFVEWMMGYPTGWTELEDSETP